MNAREWREKSGGEREKMLVELQNKARLLRFDLSTREAKNHSDYAKMKKDIARLQTLQNESVLEIEVPAESSQVDSK